MIESFDRIRSTLTVNKDSTTEEHELSQKRCKFELLLGHDARKLREDAAQVQNVDARLVVADQDCWMALLEVLFAFDDELDPCERAAETVEGPSNDVVDVEPLSWDYGHDEGDNHSPKGTDTQR